MRSFSRKELFKGKQKQRNMPFFGIIPKKAGTLCIGRMKALTNAALRK
ncbi:hypothetical protein BN855_31370 [Salmonella enterica subsp. enterica serovar Bovismorbificans str. 3114]|nr:hypothetical protein BN855_31370 [Salmonella enterica subsp. enterica serovar Bovismorbificans str. 3114]